MEGAAPAQGFHSAIAAAIGAVCRDAHLYGRSTAAHYAHPAAAAQYVIRDDAILYSAHNSMFLETVDAMALSVSFCHVLHDTQTGVYRITPFRMQSVLAHKIRGA